MEKEINKILITICTYNELENLKELIPLLYDRYKDVADLLVIDDNSPDGTPKWLEETSLIFPFLIYKCRKSKLGRGSASKFAYSFLISSRYEYIIEIDADFSHDFKDIQRFIDLAGGADIVCGSRNIEGGGYGNYPLSRVALSHLINLLLRIALGIPCKDIVQSFQLVSRKVLSDISAHEIEADGFSVYAEIKFLAHLKGFKIMEIPIVIQDRTRGVSKLTLKEQLKSVLITLKHILKLRMQK